MAAASVDDVTGVLATLSVVSNDVLDEAADDNDDFWAATAAAAAAATALETWTRLRLFCSCC